MGVLLLMNLPVGILSMLGISWVLSRWIDTRRKEKAFRRGRCQKPDGTSPDRMCGMPIVAHMDIYSAYGYKFFQWLCDEHARDGERRMRGGLYRIEWLHEGATSTQ